MDNPSSSETPPAPRCPSYVPSATVTCATCKGGICECGGCQCPQWHARCSALPPVKVDA